MIRHGMESGDRTCVVALGRSEELLRLAAKLAEVRARGKVRHDVSFVCRRSAVPGKGVQRRPDVVGDRPIELDNVNL